MPEELVTQVDDQQLEQDPSLTDDQAGGGGDGTQPAEPYLKVNDRTVYKSREDAIKGYTEAQNTITSLSEFKKVLEKYGANDASPQFLESMVLDYLRRVDAEKRAAAASKSKTTSSDEDKEFEGMTQEQIAQTKRGRDWLKANASKVGLVSKEEYDALAEKIAQLEGGVVGREEQERDAAIDAGQKKLTEWLGEAQVDLTAQERLKLENLIAAYVNHDEEILNRWLSGDRAARLELIREGYELFLGSVKPGASPTARAAQLAGAGKTKIGLVRRTPRTLPKPGGTEQTPKDAKGKFVRVGDPSLQKKAKDMIDKIMAEREGSGE